MHTPDFTDENIARIAELFPNCVTESRDENGKVMRTIDFDLLKQELSGNFVDGPQERYQLNWPGKREALLTANAPIAKTLRPYSEESVDFDSTKNLFIEGDNLDALKLLQETYLGKVKMIYIDPPYNTGNDFIYEDDFAEDKDTYFERSMQVDEEGNRLFWNAESNGRFHSDWLTMIYSRLRLARNLLTPDGVVCISIDDHELSNLIRICNEVFGEQCFGGCVSRETGTPTGGGNNALVNEVDYVLIYFREPGVLVEGKEFTEADASIYDKEDERGRYLTRSLRRTGGEDRREDRPTMYFPLTAPDGTPVYPIAPAGYESRWICGRDRFLQLESSDEIEWVRIERHGESKWQVYQKFYLEGRKKQPSNLWKGLEGNKKATRDLKKLFDGEKVFSFPKPVGLIRHILEIWASPNAIVVDFFAGSGTTAQAVIEQNLADGGNRTFLLVQLPEGLDMESRDQNTAARFCDKLGVPRNIAELTKERIRRAGKMIKKEGGLNGTNLDIGFRVLKVDTSNMKDVYYSPDAAEQASLLDQISNVKEDRTDEDLLFQVLVDWGVDLTLPIGRETISGKRVFFVDTDALAACFDQGVDEDLVKDLAKRQPLRVVFRDSGFASDAVKINVEQIFKQLSPTTQVRTI